jgi:hypothetical protein
MGKGKGHTSARREERLAEVETLLLSGVPIHQIKPMVTTKYAVRPEQVDVDVSELETRWRAEGTSREKMMLLQAYQKALAEKKFAPAITAVARLYAEKPEDSSESVRRYKRLGQPPKDGIGAVVWSQRVMVTGMKEIIDDPQMTKNDRQNMMLKFARAIAALTPYSEIHDADERIRRDAESNDSDPDPEVSHVGDGEASPLRAKA